MQTWLAKHGYYGEPIQILFDAMNWIENMVGTAAFPWVAGGLFGAAIGAWALNLAIIFDRQKLSKSERFSNLSSQIDMTQKIFWDGQRNADGHAEFDKTNFKAKLT